MAPRYTEGAVKSDHIGYPIAAIANDGTVLWQAEAVPFGDLRDDQVSSLGHGPLVRYPGQWRHDPFMDTDEPEFSTLNYNFHR